MTQAVMIRCECCGGTGKREVTGAYLETMRMLMSENSPVTGAELSRKAGCKATAMNNRLAVLESFGLAVSRRHGRKRLYTAKTGTE